MSLHVFDVRAQDLYRRHGATSPLRSLDAIQLATALHLQAQYPGDTVTLVASDHRLLELAPLVGLTVLDPIEA